MVVVRKDFTETSSRELIAIIIRPGTNEAEALRAFCELTTRSGILKVKTLERLVARSSVASVREDAKKYLDVIIPCNDAQLKSIVRQERGKVAFWAARALMFRADRSTLRDLSLVAQDEHVRKLLQVKLGGQSVVALAG